MSLLPSRKKILIATDISAGISARNTLSGIFRFINSGHNWNLRIVLDPQDFTPDAVRRADVDGYDGMIVILNSSPSTADALSEARIPAVFIDVRDPVFLNKYKARKASTAFVTNPDDLVAADAFKHLMSLGKFACFGFVPALQDPVWSHARETAFKRLVTVSHNRFFAFRRGCDADSVVDQANLMEWLSDLPKPAAIMSAWDFRAMQVLNACNQANLTIPEQIVLIGVDNDELYCNSSKPRLTSVQPDMEMSGFIAAKTLHNLMRSKRHVSGKEISVPPKGVIERESTHPIPPAECLLARAVEFIRSNVGQKLNVATVAKHLGVSQRLLEIRFQQLYKQSIAKTILTCRLNEVKRLIDNTDASFVKISRRCGFASASSLSHIFTRECGLSLKQYRSRKIDGLKSPDNA